MAGAPCGPRQRSTHAASISVGGRQRPRESAGGELLVLLSRETRERPGASEVASCFTKLPPFREDRNLLEVTSYFTKRILEENQIGDAAAVVFGPDGAKSV